MKSEWLMVWHQLVQGTPYNSILTVIFLSYNPLHDKSLFPLQSNVIHKKLVLNIFCLLSDREMIIYKSTLRTIQSNHGDLSKYKRTRSYEYVLRNNIDISHCSIFGSMLLCINVNINQMVIRLQVYLKFYSTFRFTGNIL